MFSPFLVNRQQILTFLGVNELDAKWIGWAGVNVPDEIGQRSLTEALVDKVVFQIIYMHILPSFSSFNFLSLFPSSSV